jgi:hypothetical protein
MIITATDEGFRVHTPGGPAHLVSGTPETPTCTCEDAGPGWKCAHILAVMQRHAPPDRNGAGSAPYGQLNGATRLLIKRSVSPNGRIDSLSVEVTAAIEEQTRAEVETRAQEILDVQDAIARRFLNARNGQPCEPTASEPAATNGSATSAEILNVGSMETRWGRRLFLRFQVNGQTLRRFGSEKQLGACLAAAGYPALAPNVNDGMRIGLPCQVTLEPSKNGRYLDVASVLPPNGVGQSSGRASW